MLLTFAGVVGYATSATATEPPINFVLWNADANGTFDAELWTGIVSAQYRDAITLIAQPDTGPERIETTVKAANKPVPETVVVVTKNEFSVDLAQFTSALDAFEANRDDNDTFRGSELLVSQPGCRVFQTVMGPTAYAPYTHMFTTPEYREACYAETIRTVFERDLSGTAIDKTAAKTQALMPEAYSIGWKFIDLNDPNKRAIRQSRTFAPKEEILFQTTLDFLRRANAGAPGASINVRLDLEIIDVAAQSSKKIDNLHTYDYEVSHRVPIDANYFQNFFRAGIYLEDPGDYTLIYRFTDLNAPEEKRVPVEIKADVTIE
ncbi:MAG: hypothetical protein AAGA87_08480 [Pseudomonadota bacterium]